MDWRDSCVDEISKHHCFFSALHRQRFMELFEMYNVSLFSQRRLQNAFSLLHGKDLLQMKWPGFFRN